MENTAFSSHPAWAALPGVEAALEAAEERGDAESAARLARVRYVLSWARVHAEQGDPPAYSNAPLSGLAGHLSSMASELNNFAANGNVGHLNNVDSYVDAALHLLAQLPATQLKGGAAAQANRLFSEYRDAAEESIQQLIRKNTELQESLKKQEEDHRAEVASLKTRISALSTKIADDEVRLDKMLTTANEAFTAKQTEREERFQSFLSEQGDALRELAAHDLQALDELANKAEKSYEKIDGLREGTEKVAGLASADILAGKFAEYSKEQWRWGVGANVLGFGALALGLWLIWSTLASIGFNQEVSWQYTTLKLGVTLTIVAASAVAFRLGAIFLSRSSTSKRMELELRAIGPFFSDIEDKEVVTLAKQAFVERSFGHSWDPGKRDDASDSTAESTTVILKEIVELVRTVTSRSQ